MTEKTWHLIAKRYGEDIAQDTAILYYLQFPKVENERNWCARVARRLAAAHFRRLPKDASGHRYSHDAASLDQLRESGWEPSLPAEQERLAIARELLRLVVARLDRSDSRGDPLTARTGAYSRVVVHRTLTDIRREARKRGLL